MRILKATMIIGGMLLIAGAALFFSTVGTSYTADLVLTLAGKTDSPKLTQFLLDKALRLNPYDSDTRLRMFSLFREQERLKEAEQLVLDGIELQPSASQLYLTLAAFYTGENRLDEAMTLLDRGQAGYAGARISHARPQIQAEPAPGRQKGPVLFRIAQSPGIHYYYTTDGSEPTPASREYEEAIYLMQGDYDIRVIAVSDAGIPSRLAEFVYALPSMVEALAAQQGPLEDKTAPATAVCPNCGSSFQLPASP